MKENVLLTRSLSQNVFDETQQQKRQSDVYARAPLSSSWNTNICEHIKGFIAIFYSWFGQARYHD